MECPSCGNKLISHDSRCRVCGKPTLYFHRQRRCLHCGTPAAELATTCLMCGKPIDSLPLKSSIFSGSWLGIGLGVLIVVGIVLGVTRYQANGAAPAQVQVVQADPATPTPTATVTSTAGPSHTPTATLTASPTATPTPRTHVIQTGENPSYIADLYGVTVDELVAVNNIDDVRTLQVGQELIVPASASVETVGQPGPPPPQIVYVVKSGDTLLGIALSHGTTVDAISTANPDTSLNIIFPGQSLVVPLATPTTTPTPTVTPTPTTTPGPPHPPPLPLTPVEGQVVTADTLLFNWTATDWLADDEFYVLQLTWPDGSQTEHWTQSTAWRVAKEQRPAAGPVTWTVTIMRRTGAYPDGSPAGVPVTQPEPPRPVIWP